MSTHLLLVIEMGADEPVRGLLHKDARVIYQLFHELFVEVHERQAICGEGVIYEATRTFFLNYGLLDGIPYAELNRNFAHECIVGLLDIAPNISRSKDAEREYIWSDMPQAAAEIVQKQARELQRLIDLPADSKEWVPQKLEDIYR